MNAPRLATLVQQGVIGLKKQLVVQQFSNNGQWLLVRSLEYSQQHKAYLIVDLTSGQQVYAARGPAIHDAAISSRNELWVARNDGDANGPQKLVLDVVMVPELEPLAKVDCQGLEGPFELNTTPEGPLFLQANLPTKDKLAHPLIEKMSCTVLDPDDHSITGRVDVSKTLREVEATIPTNTDTEIGSTSSIKLSVSPDGSMLALRSHLSPIPTRRRSQGVMVVLRTHALDQPSIWGTTLGLSAQTSVWLGQRSILDLSVDRGRPSCVLLHNEGTLWEMTRALEPLGSSFTGARNELLKMIVDRSATKALFFSGQSHGVSHANDSQHLIAVSLETREIIAQWSTSAPRERVAYAWAGDELWVAQVPSSYKVEIGRLDLANSLKEELIFSISMQGPVQSIQLYSPHRGHCLVLIVQHQNASETSSYLIEFEQRPSSGLSTML